MPTYEKCGDSVSLMANSVLCEYDSHRPILDAHVRIDYLFAWAERDDEGNAKGPALKKGGMKVLGLTRILGLKDRVMGRGDAEIILDGDWWEAATEAQQRAMLDHELHHVSVKTNKAGVALTDNQNRPKLVLRKHDFEVGWFSLIAQRHGVDSIEQQQAAQMMDEAGQWFWPDITQAIKQQRPTRKLVLA